MEVLNKPDGATWTKNAGYWSFKWMPVQNDIGKTFQTTFKVNQTDDSETEIQTQEISFQVVQGGTEGSLTDPRDGHVCKTIMIGTQIWMAENLAYLPSVNPSTASSNTVPHYYVYGYGGNVVNEAMMC